MPISGVFILHFTYKPPTREKIVVQARGKKITTGKCLGKQNKMKRKKKRGENIELKKEF